MAYPKLDQASLCNTCSGYNLLESYKFYGKVNCDNYKDSLSIEERAEKLRQEQPQIKYGSMYGNNN